MASPKGKMTEQSRVREAAARFADAARLSLKERKLPEARKLVEDALSLVEGSPRLYIFHARVLAELELHDEAKLAARAAFDWVRRKPERYNDYRTYLEKELADFPDIREAFFERSREIDRERADEAVQEANQFRKDGQNDEAMKLFLVALGTRTNDGPALAGIEKVLKVTNNEKGLRYLDSFRAGQLSRKDLITLVSPEDRANEQGALSEGVQDERREELGDEPKREQTLQDLVSEIEKDLENDEKRTQKRDEPPAEFSTFRKNAAKTLQNDPASRIDLAIGYCEMGLNDVALEELRAVAESHPLYLRARCLLGEFLLKGNLPLLALQAFQECLRDARLDPHEEKSVRYHLAKTYVQLGDWSRAIVEIEALEKRDPNYRDLRFLKGEVTQALGLAENAEGAVRTPKAKKS